MAEGGMMERGWQRSRRERGWQRNRREGGRGVGGRRHTSGHLI